MQQIRHIHVDSEDDNKLQTRVGKFEFDADHPYLHLFHSPPM